MSMTIEQITEEALALSEEERALLADRLAESLEPVDQKEIDRLWSIEVKRRVAEIRSGRAQTIPLEEALAQVRRSLER